MDLERARQLFEYEPVTGLLFRKGRHWKNYDGLPVISMDQDGYLRVKLFKRDLRVHRLVWLLHYGIWPTTFIDHRNRVRTDNRIDNLRECTRQQNNQNHPPRYGRKFKGVNKVSDQYRAVIFTNGQQIPLGSFDTEEEAAMAYNVAALNHFGEFAFLNEVQA